MALTDNLVAFYEFENNALDSSPASADGTVVPTISYVAGKIGQGAQEAGGRIDVSLSLGTVWSVTAWFKSSGFVGYQGAIGWETSQRNFGAGSDKFRFVGPAAASYATTFNYTTGVWAHCVTTYDGTTLRHYVNGVFDSSFVVALPAYSPLYVLNTPTGDNLNGVLDQLAFWDRELDATEAAALYNGGAGVTYADISAVPINITSITPDTGTELGGTSVTIGGVGFVSGATVTIGGASATSVVFIDDETLTAVTPVGTPGTADVVVTNPDTSSDTLVAGFLYTAYIPPPPLPPPQTTLTDGTETANGAQVIRSLFNAALAGPNWQALIEALGESDDRVDALIQNVFEQIMFSTADGKYLDILGSGEGVARPLGMDDDAYRELLIELRTGRVTYNSILRILQSFYGKEALRGYIDTASAPFALSDGDTVEFNFEGDEYTYTVDADHYQFVADASATELVVALTVFFEKKGVEAIAAVLNDPDTGDEFVRIYSPVLGLRSEVSAGGTAPLGFDSDTHTIHDGSRTVVVAQTIDGELDVQVPATVDTSRTSDTAAYIYGNDDIEIQSIERKGAVTTVITKTPHNLSTNNHVWIDDYNNAVGRPWLAATTGSTLGGSFVHGLASTGNISGTATDIAANLAAFEKLSTGDIIMFGGVDATPATKDVTVKCASSTGTVADGTQAAGSVLNNYTLSVLGAMPSACVYFGHSVLSGPHTDSIFMTGGITAVGGGAVKTTAMLTGSTWTAKSSMVTNRRKHGQITLTNGNVLVAGGEDPTALDNCELYQTLLDAWIPAGTLAFKRAKFSLVNMTDGKVLAIGGENDTGNPIRSCELYNPTTNTWSLTTQMGWTRHSYGMVVLDSGEILVMGGFGGATDDTETALATTEIYNYTSNTWRIGPQMPSALTDPWVAKLGSRVYIGSGTTIYWLDTDTFVWNLLPASARYRTAGVAGNSFVLLGGFTGTAVRYFDGIVGDSTRTNPIGINGIQKVATTPSSTAFTFSTPDRTYTALLGNSGLAGVSGSTYVNNWPSVAASRTSNITTLTVSTPDDVSAVYVNSTDANFSSGLKVLTTRTSTTVSYAEAAANNTGTVSVGLPVAVPTEQQVTALGEGEGTWIIDSAGIVYESADTVTTAAILGGSAYDTLTVASTADFPDVEGYVVLGLGTENESTPLKYLEKISSTELLMADFDAAQTWASGTTVTLVSLDPIDDIGGAFWITGSVAARIAAELNVRESVANDIALNWLVIYPGDRGLGGENTDHSDEAVVWGPDDFDSEE